MKKEYLFDKISDLKTRFSKFFQHRKKVSALENYSLADRFPHRNYLSLVKNCMNEGFLGDQESQFLDYMLTKYELNYLDWAHKTKWLKRQIAARQTSKPMPMQLFFNLDKTQASVNIPVELLNQSAKQVAKRA